MKRLVPIILLSFFAFSCQSVFAESKQSLMDYALLATDLEIKAGALDMALDEGADTAMIGSIDALEYDLGRAITPEEEAKVTEIYRSALAGILTVEIWRETTSKVYARHLSVDELRDLTDFYQSESGQKVLAIQRVLSADLGNTAEKLMSQNQQAFADAVDAALAEVFPGYGEGQLK